MKNMDPAKYEIVDLVEICQDTDELDFFQDLGETIARSKEDGLLYVFPGHSLKLQPFVPLCQEGMYLITGQENAMLLRRVIVAVHRVSNFLWLQRMRAGCL